jgi:hypothetical protein
LILSNFTHHLQMLQEGKVGFVSGIFHRWLGKLKLSKHKTLSHDPLL